MSKRNESASLIAINPTDGLREFVLAERGMLVGSDEANDLVIHDDTVSHRHAAVNIRDGQYEVSDLASTNGTFVNNRRVTDSLPLKKGDEIRFGQARFVLWAREEQETSSGMGKKTSAAMLAIVSILSVIGGVVGGAFAVTRVHDAVLARQFVLVDQNDKPRGFLTVFPQPGDPNCRTCDGKAHLVVLDQRGQPQVWPPTGPTLDPAQLLSIIKIVELLAHGGL